MQMTWKRTAATGGATLRQTPSMGGKHDLVVVEFAETHKLDCGHMNFQRNNSQQTAQDSMTQAMTQ